MGRQRRLQVGTALRPKRCFELTFRSARGDGPSTQEPTKKNVEAEARLDGPFGEGLASVSSDRGRFYRSRYAVSRIACNGQQPRHDGCSLIYTGIVQWSARREN